LSYQKLNRNWYYHRRVKKKSDEYLKHVALLKNKAQLEKTLPKHSISESEFADKNFVLPKLPSFKNKTLTPNPPAKVDTQIKMAEVVIPAEILEDAENTEVNEDNSIDITYPELNEDSISKANTLYADTCSISIKGLIKIIPFMLFENEIKLKVNDSQEMIISNLRGPWQSFLRKHFNDPNIDLIFEIDNTIEHKKIAYTSSEQFNEMIEDNDKLKQLIDKFKLKIKY
jgi:hypothetical protein